MQPRNELDSQMIFVLPSEVHSLILTASRRIAASWLSYPFATSLGSVGKPLLWSTSLTVSLQVATMFGCLAFCGRLGLLVLVPLLLAVPLVSSPSPGGATWLDAPSLGGATWHIAPSPGGATCRGATTPGALLVSSPLPPAASSISWSSFVAGGLSCLVCDDDFKK
jgi:hypothetical protein